MKKETESSATGKSADRVPTPVLVEARKLAVMRVPYLFIEQILSGRWHSIATTAPADLRILSINSSPEQQIAGMAELTVASELLDPIPDHRLDFPELIYTYKRGSA